MTSRIKAIGNRLLTAQEENDLVDYEIVTMYLADVGAHTWYVGTQYTHRLRAIYLVLP